MRFFRVTGSVTYENIWYCDCVHCDGHGGGETRVRHIDEVVEARQERHAIDKVLRKYVPPDIEKHKWISGPNVTDPPPDQVMRLVGAPTLPGICERTA